MNKFWKSLNTSITDCDRCVRLRQHCIEIASVKRRAFLEWDYWGRPVPNFGDPSAELLIVGLAPAAHGANRTGRMFTGDRSGDWLYRALHRAGFASHPASEHRDDELRLINCAITAVCHCAPPDNKPLDDELANCRPWLTTTLDHVPARIYLALGQIAWRGLMQEFACRDWFLPPPEGASRPRARPKFAHGAVVEIADNRWLLGSYHPSQQNTFTGRLTEPMFDSVFATARRLLESRVTR